MSVCGFGRGLLDSYRALMLLGTEEATGVGASGLRLTFLQGHGRDLRHAVFHELSIGGTPRSMSRYRVSF